MVLLGLLETESIRGSEKRNAKAEKADYHPRFKEAKQMRSDKYEMRACEICGKMYKPSRKDQRTCASVECVRERKRVYALKKSAEGVYRARKREYMKRQRTPEPYQPKPDTIVAIGYAERQMAETLRKAGRVKTEL